MTERPDTVHGRLLEAVHLSGYTMERACGELDWLLTDDRWQQVGGGYSDVNAFLATIDLSDFKLAVDQRRELSRKLTGLQASQRATAKALGVAVGTVNGDVNDRVQDRTHEGLEPLELVLDPASSVQDRTHEPEAWFQSDADPAKLVAKSHGRSARDDAKRSERKKAEADARVTIADAGDDARQIHHADIRSWRPTDVSCVVTDPPYITDDAVELHSQLADFALDVLPPHGALVVMTWQPILPAVLASMSRPRLVYRWTAAWTFETTARTPERKPRVFDGWKPILVFHKDGWTDDTTYLYDVVVSRDADKESHEWGQNVGGFRQLVRAVSNAGDTVCDPFVGGGTTAVAALAESRLFIGADNDLASVGVARERIAA